MLVIRAKQIEDLKAYSAKGFERELTEHIREFAPRHAEAIGNKSVAELSRLALERASEYGFTQKGPIRFFAEMMCLFGASFDTDPQLPWTAEVLADERFESEIERADALHTRMTEYDNKVSGVDKVNYFNFLERLRDENLENYRLDDAYFDSEAKRGLYKLFPQKYEVLGEQGIQELIKSAIQTAAEYSVTSNKGKAAFVALAFAIGHRFDIDPYFPWIRNTLADDAFEPEKKAEKILSKMKIYVAEVLNNRA